VKGEQVEFVLLPECLGGPAVLLRGGFDIAQDSADVNRLAAVTAVIFAELLHAENFRNDAKTQGFCSRPINAGFPNLFANLFPRFEFG